jgi:hypothetical protein
VLTSHRVMGFCFAECPCEPEQQNRSVRERAQEAERNELEFRHSSEPDRLGLAFSHKMGLYFRKGIGLGPLVLFSKSGIGISAGLRGLRARVQSNRRVYTSAFRLPVTRPAIRDVFTVATMPGESRCEPLTRIGPWHIGAVYTALLTAAVRVPCVVVVCVI